MAGSSLVTEEADAVEHEQAFAGREQAAAVPDGFVVLDLRPDQFRATADDQHAAATLAARDVLRDDASAQRGLGPENGDAGSRIPDDLDLVALERSAIADFNAA